MVLRLYIAGDSVTSRQAIHNLDAIAHDVIHGSVDLEIIDVLTDPAAAEEARILVTPTLIRLAPAPVRRLLGDLSDRDTVVAALTLN